MGWPYEFLDLTPEERDARRLVLDRYGQYAQLLALAVIAPFLLSRIAAWVSGMVRDRKGSYDAIPNSPSLKSQRLRAKGSWTAHARQLRWWLGDDMLLFGQHWGQRDQWIFGTLWTLLLLLLCVLETGTDYLHVTKRFGNIAMSQLPFHYFLALKFLNPMTFLFRSSHEQINRWHRVLGRIIYALLCLHAAFYLNFFIQNGNVLRRLFRPIVAAGFTAFVCLNLLNTTALAAVRQYSYRLFFIIHVLVGLAMPPLVFYHAHPVRYLMAASWLVFVLDLVARRLFTTTSRATLESIPGTNLIKVTAPVPYTRIGRFRDHPGSHVYLSIPPASRPSSNPVSTSYLLYEFLKNPFTVAALDEEAREVTLVARHLGGPTSSLLAKAARPLDDGGNGYQDEDSKVPLDIEGPYGAVTHFPSLAGHDFDRVLLVAGGIGATFVVPIYRAILGENPTAKVDLVWSVRAAGDATWAVSDRDAKSILHDNNVHIFLTGSILDDSSVTAGGEASTPSRNTRSSAGSRDVEIEMGPMQRDRRRTRMTATAHDRARPDLKKVVDDTFARGTEERVAVLVCGPQDMGRELRQHVRAWVMKGRSVFFHNETFGW